MQLFVFSALKSRLKQFFSKNPDIVSFLQENNDLLAPAISTMNNNISSFLGSLFSSLCAINVALIIFLTSLDKYKNINIEINLMIFLASIAAFLYALILYFFWQTIISYKKKIKQINTNTIVKIIYDEIRIANSFILLSCILNFCTFFSLLIKIH